MTPKTVYENEDVIVIDKPAGLAVHGTSENDKRETLVSFLVSLLPSRGALQGAVQLIGVGDNPLRPGIVHRLDKETSGLMVIAKNNETFYDLKKQFQERKIVKKYIALVSGIMERKEGIIDIPLVKINSRMITHPHKKLDRLPPTEHITTRYKSPHKIRQATTLYKVLKTYKDYTLVEVTPKTGRMHQIRVHFASINHPIACDKLYGRKSKKCPVGLNRHFLHASYLRFMLKSALMEFESSLPQDLSRALETLR